MATTRMAYDKLARPYELSGDAIVANIDEHLNVAIDNYWPKNAFTAWMLKQKRIRNVGGAEVRVPLDLGPANIGGTFRGNSLLRNLPKDHLEQIRVPWSNYYAPIAINFDERTEGIGGVFDLLEDRVKSAAKTIQFNFGLGLHDDGTKDYNSGGDPEQFGIIGLPKAVDDGSNYAEYMGVTYTASPTTGGPDYSEWKANLYAAHGYMSLSDIEEINLVCGQGSQDNDELPNLIMTTRTIYQDLKNQARAMTFGKPEQLSDFPFIRHFSWDGAMIMYDSNVTSGEAYFLNSNYWTLDVHRKGNMQRLGFLRAMNQAAEVDYVVLKTRLYCTCRRAQALATGITNGSSL